MELTTTVGVAGCAGVVGVATLLDEPDATDQPTPFRAMTDTEYVEPAASGVIVHVVGGGPSGPPFVTQ